jgi:lycopene cyclase domain-containing protein
LNPKYLYLLVNCIALIIPLAFSFSPRANFSKKWKHVLPGIFVSAIFFIAWDMLFTKMGVWGFNPKYITGVYVYVLPLEEVLFFFTIPYACLFTFFALNHLIEKDYLFPHHELISSFLIIVTLIAGIYFLDKWYTSTTCLLTGFFLSHHMLNVRPRYMGRFYFTFFILLIPFLLINGLLTGSFTDEPVVWYDHHETIGVRLFTIPAEDILFGMMVMLIPIYLTDKLEERFPEKNKSPMRRGFSVLSSK